MNESLPQPRLRVSVLVVGGLLLVGFGALVVYGPGMIPWPELPALPSSEPQVEVVQLPEEFSKPLPRAVVQPVAAPIVATEPTEPGTLPPGGPADHVSPPPPNSGRQGAYKGRRRARAGAATQPLCRAPTAEEGVSGPPGPGACRASPHHAGPSGETGPEALGDAGGAAQRRAAGRAQAGVGS